ncbi:E3 ubiquitin/ISG15 ligase TRIM25-like [Carassius auratus]|uniref:E3 ubiquitin/ISG15 ligase TRIM25-like n=1 Tax=Carassius auratus TaxID=7957 RepID=A0A6P6LXH1_CARAU|nr:E3 ubiquitin/ISG15 ligase TRIM25-like [Carassius auratus]XP_026089175.1 E3 ubiquitin/ISG15 ligase TRIM25-like [Carassius auratus]
MAEAIPRDHDQYSCSICLDLLKDPVTIPCGHSYCMSCINECWNTNDLNGIYRCPQCRHAFKTKPPLNRSTVLAEIMEKLRSTELQVSESAQSLAGPGEIACDFCAGEMIKAVKSCLECRVSYCETHVQPHYNVPALKKHKLVKAAVIPVCPKHDKLLEVYCRTDQKCVCMHCLLDDHKSHDTVPSTIERNDKQIKLTDTQKKVKQTIQAKERELQEMNMDIASHSDSAKKAVENSKKVFSELAKLIEKKGNEVIEKIKAEEKADLDQGTKLQKKLQEEITELKKREGVLEDLLQTDDNIQFLQNFESVSSSSGSDGFPSHSFKPCCPYPDVNNLVCELKKQLETIFNQEINETVQKGSLKLNCNIKIGDKVCVKPSVETPKYLWGSVSHKSIGSVINVQGESVTVNFPEQEGWIGDVSEMELVVSTDLGFPSHAYFKTGNRVRVKSSVKDPKHGWGSVTHNSIGVIKRIQGESLTVEFPEQTDWTGIASEMELINGDFSEVLSLRPGVRVRVKPTIRTPAHGWGSVTKDSIGVVVAIDGTKVTVNFPEQFSWTGIVSEMEAVP